MSFLTKIFLLKGGESVIYLEDHACYVHVFKRKKGYNIEHRWTGALHHINPSEQGESVLCIVSRSDPSLCLFSANLRSIVEKELDAEYKFKLANSIESGVCYEK